METIMKSKTMVDASVTNVQVKAQSATAAAIVAEDGEVKKQTSAPSYLFSLKENKAPPFRRPGPEAKPKLLIGTIMNERDAVEMIAAASEADGLRVFLGNFLVSKEIVANYNISERDFLISLLTETVDYAAQHGFDAFKLACLITVYLATHVYFKWYYWLPPSAVWSYFKELMIRHTIEDSPDSQEVFQPDECYDIVTHFHTVYLTNLPLIHILTFGAYRLKFVWPLKPK